jgi:hypothetical protein
LHATGDCESPVIPAVFPSRGRKRLAARTKTKTACVLRMEGNMLASPKLCREFARRDRLDLRRRASLIRIRPFTLRWINSQLLHDCFEILCEQTGSHTAYSLRECSISDSLALEITRSLFPALFFQPNGGASSAGRDPRICPRGGGGDSPEREPLKRFRQFAAEAHAMRIRGLLRGGEGGVSPLRVRDLARSDSARDRLAEMVERAPGPAPVNA